MPLISTCKEDLNKEYLSKLFSYQSAQLNACYAFGAYSDQEEKYDIKISKLAKEYHEKLKSFKEKEQEEIKSP